MTVAAVRRFLVENTALKLVSLGLALLIWYSVSSEQVQRDLTLSSVPLHVTNLRSDLLVAALATKVVDMRVRGPAQVVSDLRADDLSVSIDVTRLAPGNHDIRLDPSLVRRPSGVEVLRIDPPSIPLTLERLITRVVPVVPRFDETLSSKHVITGTKVEPPSVEVTGPESTVGDLREIKTKAISVEAANSEVTFIGALDDSHLGQVKITPAEVKVTAFVEGVNEREFSAVPVRKPRQVITSTPPWVNVIIAGPQSAVSRVEAKDIAVTVNAEGLQTGSYEVAPVVQVLKDVAGQLRSIRTEPEKVSIQVR